jgi:hypothetical protein
MNFSKIDNLLIGFFLFIFIASIYLLMNHSSGNARLKQADDIGTITNIKNTVKRKNINNINWHDVSESEAIQEDDVIFTNDKSSALLTFKDGSRLNIEGDSLIRLKDLKDSVEVLLERGEIQINSTNKINVGILGENSRKIGIDENATFQLSNRGNNLEIHAIEGTANDSAGTEIKSGENINISKGVVKNLKSTVRLSEGHISNEGAYIEWSNESELKNFTIQISEDPLFTVFKSVDAANSPIKISWNKPVAYVKIISNDPSQKMKQSVVSKIYLKNKPKDKMSQSEEESIMDNVVRYYNKMLDNSKKLEKNNEK